MEDIYHWCREGNALQVRVYLDDTEHDPNEGDDHGFSPLHWASKAGHVNIVDLLITRGSRINATNLGDDTPLHLASAHGHRDIVHMLLRNKADVNAVNEHGNTPLHYACFWAFQSIAEDLINNGAVVAIANKYGETPLEKSKGQITQKLLELAIQLGQDTKKIPYKDQSWLGTKTRSRDATLSRTPGIAIKELSFQFQLASKPSGEIWRGMWQQNDICCKILNVRDVTPRVTRDFMDEFPKLRIFSHPNVLPVIGCCCHPPSLIVINQYMSFGSLYTVLHEGTGIVVDTAQALKFAMDICRGMSFLHSLNPIVPRYYLSSRHVMIDDDLTARLNMADAKFSFQEKGKIYNPQWMAPEALQKKPEDINVKAADMWSFGVLLYELATREVPFAELSPMEIGMCIALESLRIAVPPGISGHMSRLINICLNEDPGKRPTFDMILPILEKMKQ